MSWYTQGDRMFLLFVTGLLLIRDLRGKLLAYLEKRNRSA